MRARPKDVRVELQIDDARKIQAPRLKHEADLWLFFCLIESVRALGQALRILLRLDATVRWPPKDGQPAPTFAILVRRADLETTAAVGDARKRQRRDESQTCLHDES